MTASAMRVGDQDQRGEQLQAYPELVGRGPEEEPGQRLHRGVAGRDALLAVPAPPAEKQVGDEGHVVPGPDGLSAVWAVGRRPHYRLVAGYAVDHDVQKAADHQPEEACDED